MCGEFAKGGMQDAHPPLLTYPVFLLAPYIQKSWTGSIAFHAREDLLRVALFVFQEAHPTAG